ncbi:MAG TPA: hypothetical protein DCM86_19275 [Verrucomicrobiales bacterium]|nr:hypothetical protein [Verrucomicrobiales bacterium]
MTTHQHPLSRLAIAALLLAASPDPARAALLADSGGSGILSPSPAFTGMVPVAESAYDRAVTATLLSGVPGTPVAGYNFCLPAPSLAAAIVAYDNFTSPSGPELRKAIWTLSHAGAATVAPTSQSGASAGGVLSNPAHFQEPAIPRNGGLRFHSGSHGYGHPTDDRFDDDHEHSGDHGGYVPEPGTYVAAGSLLLYLAGAWVRRCLRKQPMRVPGLG